MRVLQYKLTEAQLLPDKTIITNHLRFTTVHILPNIECMEDFRSMVTPLVLCTFGHGKLTGPCMGDSGGPITIYDSKGKFPVQIGLVSFGSKECETKATVYTRIQAYLSWINGYIHGIRKIS